MAGRRISSAGLVVWSTSVPLRAGNAAVADHPVRWLLLLALALAGRGGAQESYDLSYRFTAGEVFGYETTTQGDGRFVLRVAGEPPRQTTVSTTVTDLAEYQVEEVGEGGAGRVAVRLSRLQVASPEMPDALLLERIGDEALRLQRGPKRWVVAKRPDGTVEAPAEAREGFGELDPTSLMEPARFTLAATGEVLEQRSESWFEKLAATPLLGPLAALFQPFGSPLLELPGARFDSGRQWEQDREVALPGGGGATYPVAVRFKLGERAKVGPYATVRVDFAGHGAGGDQPFAIELANGATLPMTAESVAHNLSGYASFDFERGRVVEQRLRSVVEAVGRGRLRGRELRTEATVTVESKMILLAAEGTPG